MFVAKEYLALSMVGAFLSCTGITASSASSDAVAEITDVQFFKRYLEVGNNEQYVLRLSMYKDAAETERLMREYKACHKESPITREPIGIGLLYEIFLLTELADRGNFLKDAFYLRKLDLPDSLCCFTWNSFENSKTIEEFIKLNASYSGYPEKYLISELYSKGLIPQNRLRIFVTIIAECIIKTPFDRDIIKMAKMILSSDPYPKTGSPKTLTKDGVLKLSVSDDKTIQLDPDLTKKVEGSLTRDYSVVDDITSYLQKAREEGRMANNKFEFWSKAVEKEKQNYSVRKMEKVKSEKIKPDEL